MYVLNCEKAAPNICTAYDQMLHAKMIIDMTSSERFLASSCSAVLQGHKRNFVCDDGDSHHHFFKVEFILWQENVFLLLPEAFCGLKYAENATAAGALPRTLLGELTTLPQILSRLDSGHPSPYPNPHGAFGTSMLAPRSSCPPDTKSWRRHWSPPLFKAKLRQWSSGPKLHVPVPFCFVKGSCILYLPSMQ